MSMQDEQFKTQVPEGYYAHGKYDTLERFISYYYQIESVLKLSPRSVLEIGVGNKTVAHYLREMGIAVQTADFDAVLKPDIVSDVRKLSALDKSYDAVVACQILEHIPFDDFGIALGELMRVSKRYVIISLPYRSSYFEIVVRFPFIRKFFGRTFFDFVMRKKLAFAGFESSGQHHWEIDKNNFRLGKVRAKIEEYFTIVDEFSPVLNKYHYFFVLEIRNYGK